ncbi:hypothetical protein BXZ70DRAFT_703762 [Cristinia sonorae]|uniref:Uncharacterized protein n=1 Tax=Cristinia sonorae TaxID=1940300 RepID=A0A8K0XJV0_9AGAR|nr:hypothetical protein BXZ70DRAFT_703762 [Cristinia sonorae]
MVASITRIPWFSYGPFHAAMGIMTVRLLLHLHKAVHRLQNMSDPGSTVYMSHRAGPLTVNLKNTGNPDEGEGDRDGDEEQSLDSMPLSSRDSESESVVWPQCLTFGRHGVIDEEVVRQVSVN